MATNSATKQAEYSRRWREKYPEKKREYHRRTRYGITPEQYAALVAEQGGACAIGRHPPTARGLCVDHCHRTGVVRGLLCMLCNTAIGKMGDSPARLRAAAAYLDERIGGILPGNGGAAWL